MQLVAENAAEGYIARIVGKRKRKAARSPTTVKLILVSADALSFVLAFLIAHQLLSYSQLHIVIIDENLLRRTINYGFVTLFGLGVIGTSFAHYKLRKTFWDELRELWLLIVVLAVIDAALSYASNITLSRYSWGINWVMMIILLPYIRFFTKNILILSNNWTLPAIIIGTGHNARSTVQALRSDVMLGYNVYAFLDLGTSQQSMSLNDDMEGLPILKLDTSIETKICELGYPHVFIALEQDEYLQQREFIEQMSTICDELHVVPPFFGMALYGLKLTHIFSYEMLLLHGRNNLSRPLHRFAKRLFDVTAATIGFIIFLPLLIYIAFRIWLVDGSPVIYWQERIGQNDRRFRICKFRTMVRSADEILQQWKTTDPARWQQYLKNRCKLTDDPRIFPIGRWLRKYSLDELPQLYNILMGDMSFVGPRPIVEDEASIYGKNATRYYLQTRPGITGLAQISGRSNISFEQRIGYDIWYIKNWSLWYDFVILIKTLRIVYHRVGVI